MCAPDLPPLIPLEHSAHSERTASTMGSTSSERSSSGRKGRTSAKTVAPPLNRTQKTVTWDLGDSISKLGDSASKLGDSSSRLGDSNSRMGDSSSRLSLGDSSRMGERFKSRRVSDTASNDSTEISYPGGLASLLFGGDLLSDDEDKVIQATIHLKGLLRAGNETANALQFVALGGHALLVTVMKKWETHPVIQYRLCASMADFTYNFLNSKNDINIFSALVQMGTMDLVVGAMARFAHVENFQYTCMLIIGNLCTDCGRACKKVHAELFVHHLQGIKFICKAMRQFPKNGIIQQTGTWLLEALCCVGMAKVPEMKGEALAAVALAVQAFPGNKELSKDARSFMKKIMK